MVVQFSTPSSASDSSNLKAPATVDVSTDVPLPMKAIDRKSGIAQHPIYLENVKGRSLLDRQIRFHAQLEQAYPKVFTTTETLDRRRTLAAVKRTPENKLIDYAARTARPQIEDHQKKIEGYLNGFNYDLNALKTKQMVLAMYAPEVHDDQIFDELQAVNVAIERYEGANDYFSQTPDYEISYLKEEKFALLFSVRPDSSAKDIKEINDAMLEINAAISKCAIIQKKSDAICDGYHGPLEQFGAYAQNILSNCTPKNKIVMSHAITLAISKVEHRKMISIDLLRDSLMEKFQCAPEALEEQRVRLLNADPDLIESEFCQAIEQAIVLVKCRDNAFESDSESNMENY